MHDTLTPGEHRLAHRSRSAAAATATALVALFGLASCSDDAAPSLDASPAADAPQQADASAPDASASDAMVPTDAAPQPMAHDVTIVFPPHSAYTTASQLTVRGTAENDGTIADIQVAGISVQTSDEFAHWRVQVPVSPGANRLAVTTVDTDGVVRAEADDVMVLRPQDAPVAPTAMAIDVADNRSFFIDSDPAGAQVVALELTHNSRAVVSGPARGAGDPLVAPTAVAFDPAGARLLVTDDGADAVIAIDIATGDRTAVSSAAVGSGPQFDTIVAIAIDSANDRALVAEQQAGAPALIAVALATGNRTVVSNSTTGTGQGFGQMLSLAVGASGFSAFIGQDNGDILFVDLITGNRSLFAIGPWRVPAIAIDAAGERLLFISENDDAVLAFGLTSGVLTTIAGPGVGVGPDLQMPVGLALDLARDRVLVADTARRAIVDVAIDTGDRADMSAIVLGVGPAPDNPSGLHIDDANDRLIFYSTTNDSLMAANRTTGDRSILVDTSTMPPDLSNIWNPTWHSGQFYAAHGFSPPYVVSFDPAAGTFAVVSDTGVGTGPQLYNVRGLAIDSANNRALLSSFTATKESATGYLHWVDLATGNRTEVAGPSTSSGLTDVGSLVIDGDRALVQNRDPGEIVAVDLTTGAGTTLSGSGVGSGFGMFDQATYAMALDSANNRLLVAFIFGDDPIAAIDLTTGDRTIISDANTGAGPMYGNARALTLSPGDDFAYLSDRATDALYAIDLTNGERVIVNR